MGKAHRKGTYLFGTKTLGSANSWDVAVSEVLAESRMTVTAELKCKRKCEINFGSLHERNHEIEHQYRQ